MNDEIILLPTDAQQFAVQLTAEKSRRQLLKRYISEGLTSGVDYGIIKGDKPCLLKPGAEKYCSLLDLQPRFTSDPDTASMLSDEQRIGLFLFKCELIHRKSGQVVSEGRGCCAVKDKKGEINTALKIAEKRAQVDAVLRMGLSDTFTQDLDDMDCEKTAPKIDRDHIIREIHKTYLTVKCACMSTDRIDGWVSGVNNFTDNQLLAGLEGLRKIKI